MLNSKRDFLAPCTMQNITDPHTTEIVEMFSLLFIIIMVFNETWSKAQGTFTTSMVFM